MNILDKVIKAVSPGTALKRAQARRMLHIGEQTGYYRDAAVSGTNRKMANTPLDHPDSSRNHSDRITLIKEARQLEENNPVVSSILRKFKLFTVGRLNYIPRTSSDAANKEIADYVERWMLNADLTGRHSFRELAGLAVTSMKRDGDIGFIFHEVPETSVDGIGPICPVRLQAIEADRIGAVYVAGSSPHKPFKPLKKGEQDFSGVVVDKVGKPVRYRVFSRQEKSAQLVPWAEVPAEDFCHLFDPVRADGYRGFSIFGSGANDIKDAQEILACEKQSVKYLSSVSGVVKNAMGEAPSDVLLDTAHPDYNADAARLKAVNPGEIHYIAEGEDFNALNYDRPTPTFSGFLDTLIRWTSLSAGLPFGCTYSWAGQGTAVRMEAAQADREFQQTQLVLEEKFLIRVITRVIATGVRLGHISPVQDFDKGEWRYPARVTADVGRESKALIEEQQSGLISKTQIAADRGEDRTLVRKFIRDESLELIEDAKAIVTASGGEIDLKLAIYMLERRGPNAPVEPPEPAAKPGAKSDD